jgi:SET domain-containing protein
MQATDFDIKDSTQAGVGKGLFARTPITKGTFILEYTGIPMTGDAADDHPGRYLFELNDKVTLDGDTPENTSKYINHSCDPSVEAEIDEDADGSEHINIYALRDIAAGEELFIDYDTEYFDEFIRPHGCQCGSAKCLAPKH